MRECRELLKQIFEPYQFYMQQFVTNDSLLQGELDRDCQLETPQQVKLLELRYDREADVISTVTLHLDREGGGNGKRKSIIISSLKFGYISILGSCVK